MSNVLVISSFPEPQPIIFVQLSDTFNYVETVQVETVQVSTVQVLYMNSDKCGS